MIALGTWSAITAIFIIVISLVYRKFSRRKQHESPSH
jgi:amino acid transporter